MAICIILYKLSENGETVSYKFETSVAADYYLSKNGNLRRELRSAYGYCEFHIETETFILDKEKTDPHYFEKPYYEGVNYEAFKVWMRLIIQKRAGEFPDFFSICC